jgi:hypothetical protein
VEPQGSAGFTRLVPAAIAAADAVIFGHDVPVRVKERFAGKPAVDVGVKAAANRPGELIDEGRGRAALGTITAPAAPGRTAPLNRGAPEGDRFGTKLRTWLMTGVGHIVASVAARGLLGRVLTGPGELGRSGSGRDLWRLGGGCRVRDGGGGSGTDPSRCRSRLGTLPVFRPITSTTEALSP